MVRRFTKGKDNDQTSFQGIAFVDVVTDGRNTQFRLGDGIRDNEEFGTGDLLVTLVGTHGFTASNIAVNVRFDNKAQFLFA